MTERLHFHFSLSCIGEGNGNPLQCSCLENPRDGGAWWAAIYGVAQSWTRLKRLSSSKSIQSGFSVVSEAEVDVVLEFSSISRSEILPMHKATTSSCLPIMMQRTDNSYSWKWSYSFIKRNHCQSEWTQTKFPWLVPFLPGAGLPGKPSQQKISAWGMWAQNKWRSKYNSSGWRHPNRKGYHVWSMGPQHSEHWLKLKKKKESKHNTKDGHQTTREENKRGREGKRPTNLKQLTKW